MEESRERERMDRRLKGRTGREENRLKTEGKRERRKTRSVMTSVCHLLFSYSEPFVGVHRRTC